MLETPCDGGQRDLLSSGPTTDHDGGRGRSTSSRYTPAARHRDPRHIGTKPWSRCRSPPRRQSRSTPSPAARPPNRRTSNPPPRKCDSIGILRQDNRAIWHTATIQFRQNCQFLGGLFCGSQFRRMRRFPGTWEKFVIDLFLKRVSPRGLGLVGATEIRPTPPLNRTGTR